MLVILLVLILTHEINPQNLFENNADSIFRTIIGGVDETFAKLDEPNNFDIIRQMEESFIDPANAESDIVKGLDSEITTRLISSDAMGGITLEDLQIRMRKLYLNQLVNEEYSPMPDFSKDTDGTEHLTRRFRQIVRSRASDYRRNRGGNKGIRHSTPQGFDYDEFEGMRDYQKYLKNLTLALMEQFIYSTQYKLPFLLKLRNKYKTFYRYKIGYCFALLRLLQHEQRIIYTTLDRWHLHFNNLMIHLKLYEKVVRLDVDIKDLCALIRLMNYKQKLLQDPDYYIMLDHVTEEPANSSSTFPTPSTPVI